MWAIALLLQCHFRIFVQKQPSHTAFSGSLSHGYSLSLTGSKALSFFRNALMTLTE